MKELHNFKEDKVEIHQEQNQKVENKHIGTCYIKTGCKLFYFNPENDQMKANQDQSQPIGEFLDWLQNEKKIVLCKWDEKISEHHPQPVYTNIETLLAEYFGVDLKKAEKERKAILDNLNK